MRPIIHYKYVSDFFIFFIWKPGGSLFITTLNKTKISYVLGIVLAEKVMSLVPEGTHDWDKFIPPEELERLLESSEYYECNPLCSGFVLIAFA